MSDNKIKKTSVRAKYPTKRYINFANVGVKTTDKKMVVAVIVVIAAAAAIFAMYGVVGRFMSLSRAQAEADNVQAQLDAGYAQIANYDVTEDEYAHYTFSGMSDTELAQVEREDVLRLLDETVIGKCEIENWSVAENILNIRLVDSTLNDVNSIMQDINADDLVSYCTVSTAVKDDGRDDVGKAMVTADIVVYLNGRTVSGSQNTDTTEETSEGKSLVETVKDFSGASQNGEEGDEQ